MGPDHRLLTLTGTDTPIAVVRTHVRRDEPGMATVLDQILAAFHERLSASSELDPTTIKALHSLFQSGKRLKADDFVAVFENSTKEDPQ